MSNQKIPDTISFGTTIDAYSTNKFFDDYVLQKDYYPYQFDGWRDKKNYGIVDASGRAIYPKSSLMSLNSNDNGISYRNMLFVTDAFNDMRRYHKSFLTGNKFNNNGSIYINLDIKSGATDLDDLYIKYMNDTYNVFYGTYLTTKRIEEIKDFNSFARQFISFCKLISSSLPILRSSFIKSKICPSTISGLTIDFIDKPKYTNVKAKADKYLSDPNFDIFIESARRYGFYVDRNAPWRLVADLSSPVMIDYYNKYGFKNVDDVFAKCYHIAYYSDLETLKNILISFWNTFANKVGSTSQQLELPNCSGMFAQINTFNQLDVKTFDYVVNINWLLRLYIFIKINENNIELTQNNFEIIFKEAVHLNEYADQESAVEYINRKIEDLLKSNNREKFMLTTADQMIKILSLENLSQIATGVNF